MKDPKNRSKIIIGALVIIVLSIFVKIEFFPSSLSSRQDLSNFEKITNKESLEQLDLWIEDIEYLVKNLEDKHKNIYHSISQKELRQEVEAFKKDIDNLDNVGKFIRIKSIVAKIGDGHTRVSNNVPLNWFPISFKEFDDGIYVSSCSKKYEEILGSRVIGINGINIDEIILDMSDMISHDNAIDLTMRTLFVATCADFLKYYNIIDNVESAMFEFETATGDYINVSMDSFYHKENPADWISIDKKYKNIENLLYKTNNDNYWYEYFPSNKLVYFQYNRCMENKDKPIKAFISELLAFLEENEVERFIFDIRNNGGGNSRIIEPLIEGLANNETINKHGNLFVVIGKSTYSSAILNAIKLRQETNSILIGESTGGMPNHYGEVKTFNLPNSGLRVSYSTKYFKHSETDADSIYPDIKVNYTFENFISGIDPVMREILEITK